MSLPVSIEKALSAATEQLVGISDSPRLDAELLVARAIDVPRSYLFAHPEDLLDPGAVARLEASLVRRLGGEPMAYITGTREFWSLDLAVSPAVLVPRPETECLVDVALRDIPRQAVLDVLDLGTGSGAIALALATERARCRITAVDVSEDALAVARLNARQLGVGNIEYLHSDWTAAVSDRLFDRVVCNPPYVAAGDAALDSLPAEPQLALAAGPDGLAAIRRIAAETRTVIRPGGRLVLEHGPNQREAVAGILGACGWTSVECYDDLAGHPRVTRALYITSETT